MSSGFGSMLGREWRRATHPPYEAPLVILANGLLMTGAWFLLPTGAQDALFTIHSDFAFALVLSSWMYADVPATNVLGTGARASLEVLDDPPGLRRLLAVRNVVLWLFVTPICVLIAIGTGFYEGDAIRTALVVVAIIVPPFGALGLSAWLGVRFPYHPIPLRQRWAARHTSRVHMLYRWGALVTLPYVIVPTLAVITVLPAYFLWAATGHGLGAQVSNGWFAVGSLLTGTISIAMWFGGMYGSTRIARKHRDALAEYLADPSRG
jgi:hypothetical protein